LAIAAERELVRGALRDVLPDLARQPLARQRLELEDVDRRSAERRRRTLCEREARQQAAVQRAEGAGHQRERLASFHAGILEAGPRRGHALGGLRHCRRLEPRETEAVVAGDIRVDVRWER